MTTANDTLRLAVPKGRILEELLPVLARAGIEPEAAFSDKHERKLEFATNIPNLSILRVRSFDIATFVAFGAAQMGVAGRDVLMEFDYPEVYAPLDLGIGYCRMVVAEKEDELARENPKRWSHVRVATKYRKSPAGISPSAACRPNVSSLTARWKLPRRWACAAV